MPESSDQDSDKTMNLTELKRTPAAELSKHGIDIARRTVAKYRNLMDIPPARKRKQY